MVTIMVVAHPEIANSMISCLEHIMAKRFSNLHIIQVKKTENTEHVLHKANSFIASLGKDAQVLILTDLFGATPSNIASRLVKRGKVELITGVNMPMLLRAINYAGYDLATCVAKAIEGGKNGIVYLNEENI